MNFELIRTTPVAEWFEAKLGREPSVLVRAPGRVNLIGEHTDYNEGWVLPAALELGTTVAAGARPDRELRVFTLLLAAEDRSSLDDLQPAQGAEWTRYVRGMAGMLQDSGLDLPGADLVITGDLPLRAGLSSSVSLEMAVGVALCELAGTRIDPVELARLGRRAENEILGVQSGLMDQLAVACGRQGHALLIDCRTAAVEPVAVPDRARFLVLDTGVRRRLSDSAYNRRRAECALALRKLQAVHPEVLALRDATIEMLVPNGNLLDEVELRRVRHVVTEDDRVLRAAETLGRADLEELGRLMTASHVSLRDDFEVSCPELDVMVEAALSHPRVLGARLTGAGFGGCAVALVDSAWAEHASESIAEAYCRRTGRAATIYVCEPSEGASVIPLQ